MDYFYYNYLVRHRCMSFLSTKCTQRKMAKLEPSCHNPVLEGWILVQEVQQRETLAWSPRGRKGGVIGRQGASEEGLAHENTSLHDKDLLGCTAHLRRTTAQSRRRLLCSTQT